MDSLIIIERDAVDGRTGKRAGGYWRHGRLSEGRNCNGSIHHAHAMMIRRF